MQDVKQTYIRMVPIDVPPSRKTRVWSVRALRDDAELGQVKWFGRWRKYAFFPIDAIFEEVCLREVADFIEAVTREHRAMKQAQKKP